MFVQYFSFSVTSYNQHGDTYNHVFKYISSSQTNTTKNLHELNLAKLENCCLRSIANAYFFGNHTRIIPFPHYSSSAVKITSKSNHNIAPATYISIYTHTYVKRKVTTISMKLNHHSKALIAIHLQIHLTHSTL